MRVVTINPFFEPGARPLPLPIPLAQTLMTRHTHAPTTLLAHRELVVARSRNRASISLPSSSPPRYRPLSPPYSQPRRVSFITPPPIRKSTASEAGDSDNESDLSELSELSSHPGEFRPYEQEDTFAKIPKPKGEAGRPGREGYTLDAYYLSWPESDFNKLKVQ